MTRPADISEQVWERADILRDHFKDITDDTEFVARILMEVGQGCDAPEGMTHMQAKTLEFVRKYQAANRGASPSYREIGAAIGRHKSGVHDLLHRLATRGVVRLSLRARSITIVDVSAAHKNSEVA